ncbi:hypothetical protein ACH35V_13260 [Actinomadura sp. 1N219]|uniref:hypothetical protein n=1 Tax=Actinomadura sp. 1N219 TaxID=3375152 RepID=UPI0037A93D8D
MTATSPDDWSPADNPYAIAVSEAQWWLHTVELAISRMRKGEKRWTSVFSDASGKLKRVLLAVRRRQNLHVVSHDVLPLS